MLKKIKKAQRAHRYVLTGGPGVGKTSLLKKLRDHGFHTISEVATSLIEQALKQGLPNPAHGKDVITFQNNIWATQLDLECELQENQIAFLDRGLLDNLAYYEFNGVQAPQELFVAAQAINYKKVFVLDFLDTFQNTAVRKENIQQAKKIHNLIADKYATFGLPIVTVPSFAKDKEGRRLSAQESIIKRAEFVRENMQ